RAPPTRLGPPPIRGGGPADVGGTVSSEPIGSTGWPIDPFFSSGLKRVVTMDSRECRGGGGGKDESRGRAPAGGGRAKRRRPRARADGCRWASRLLVAGAAAGAAKGKKKAGGPIWPTALV